MTTLSDMTLKAYNSKLNIIRNDGEFTDDDIENHPNNILNWIKDTYPNLGTQNTYLSALLYFTNKNQVYFDYFKLLKKQLDELKNQQKLPENKIINYKKWSEYLTMFNQAEKENKPIDDLVIMGLYTLIAPVRLDYAGMKIIKDVRHAKGIDDNYCLLRKTKPIFIFREFKTSKSKGEVSIRIPKRLYLLLLRFYDDGKRNVIYDATPDALGKRIAYLFGSSLNMLRHSFIDFRYKNDLTIVQKEKIAHDMMNSPNVAEQYRTMNNNVEED